MSVSKVEFNNLFEDWVNSGMITPSTNWTSIEDIKVAFLRSVPHPIEVTNYRLGRALTGKKFTKKLKMKPYRLGYLVEVAQTASYVAPNV